MSATTVGIKNELKEKSEKVNPSSGEATPSLDSAPSSRVTRETSVVSRSYLKNAAEHLISWMDKMGDKEADPANVNAVCNIAQQIANIVKVNIELKKNGL